MEEKVGERQPLLLLGEPAPDFEAASTEGKIKLSDFKGKRVILFANPADFTPVCTTESVAFANTNEEPAKRNIQLIGLSVTRGGEWRSDQI